MRRGGGVSEVAFLQANISGGDSAIGGMYLFDYGTTTSGGVLDQWDDARGAVGFGPSVPFIGAARPAVGADFFTFDGAATQGSSAASAALGLSTAASLVVVARGTTSPNSSGVVAAISIAGTDGIEVGLYNTDNFYGGFSPGAVLVNSTSSSATRRLALVAFSTTTGYAEVPNVAQQSGVITAPSNANAALLVGTGIVSGFGDCEISAIVKLNRLYTADDKTALKSWASTYYGASAA